MKTNVRTTSLQAFHGEVKEKRPTRQESIMRFFDHYDHIGFGITNTEIADYIGWPINTVTPRVNELCKKGRLEEFERRKCKITGRLAIAWRPTKQQSLNI